MARPSIPPEERRKSFTGSVDPATARFLESFQKRHKCKPGEALDKIVEELKASRSALRKSQQRP